MQDGKMRMVNGRLPIGSDGIPETGFNRNWWVGLELMHTLFVSEHNAIADHLKQNHPNWSDERLFQTARLINAALMAKIHTVDWTPAILKNYTLREAMFANWRGFLPYGFPEFGNPATDGIMGGERDLAAVPFSLTEEFTALYRMHPLLRDSLQVRNYQNNNLLTTSNTQDHAFQGATALTDTYGLTNLFYSFGLNPITDFTDITPNSALAEKLRDIYNDDVEMIDVMIGSYAEGYRPPGYGFGETSFQIFIAMASRRLMADRFFTDDFRAEIYSAEGLDWVDDNNFQTVLIRHMPELAGQLEKVENPFFPWDEENEWFLEEYRVRR